MNGGPSTAYTVTVSIGRVSNRRSSYSPVYAFPSLIL